MPNGAQELAGRGWRQIAHSLSGRILLLTALFVMTSVALVYFPSVARYHHQLLVERVDAAGLVILPFTETPIEEVSDQLRRELLARAGVLAVILRSGGAHELILMGGGEPQIIQAVYNAGDTTLIEQIRDVIRCLMAPEGRIIRIDAEMVMTQDASIVVVANEEPIRAAVITFSARVLVLSLFVSGLTAALVFVSLYLSLVRPMRRITTAMIAFRVNPEDSSHILEPSGRKDEIGIVERELSSMQREIYGSLQQKTRLASLGMAVAKIQHDLRNILSSAQIASDRLATIEDPMVKRLVPRLVASLDRAVALATHTLRYGKADEQAPRRQQFALAPLVDEVAASALSENANISFANAVEGDFKVDADPDQLFRILLNLVKNAREALEVMPESATAQEGRLDVEAWRADGAVHILISDNGPGIDMNARDKLFRPFAAVGRTGSAGLGLAIARELAQAHGGDVSLLFSSESGTRFQISIPDRQ